MKRLLCVLALCWSGFASANLIQISTDAVDVNPGDVVNFQIELVDFEDFDLLSFALSFDDLLVQFDFTSLLEGPTVVFGDLLVLDFPDQFVFVIDSDPLFGGSGTVYGGSFVLATFDFLAIDSGSAQFSGLFDSLIDDLALGQNISVNTPTFGVAPATVSEPSVMAILMMGLVVLGLPRRMK